jgi:metallo-beta-lactamase class B
MFARLALMAAVAFALGPSALHDAHKQGRRLAVACKGKDGWTDHAPPARIHGNTYFVGTCGITALLLVSAHGHVLIDGGPPEAAPLVLANIRALGFRPEDVRTIIGSHEHADHMGGLAALKAATGATLIMREPARTVVESGPPDAADPQTGTIPAMPPVKVDRIISDGGYVGRVDKYGLDIRAIATPGHTSGGTSWIWLECDKTCVRIAYVDSLTAVSRDGYRFTDHPERVAPFRETFKRVAAMPCDILITPHPGASNLFARLAGDAPLIDNQGCKKLADAARVRLDERLAKERAQ